MCTELERIVGDGGVALEDKELSVGRRAIAAVVVDAEGRPVAAVELAVSGGACTREGLSEELGPQVITTAREIDSDQAGVT